MKIKRKYIAVLLVATMLSGCAARTAQDTVKYTELYESTIFAMDTVMDLQIYGEQSMLDEAEELIFGLERLLSVTNVNSEIYRLNHEGRAELSDDTAKLLEQALELCERTDGALDITIYPAVRAWGFTTGDYRVPDSGELAEILENVDYTGVSLEGTSAALPDGMEVDLGSVAKGYTSTSVLDMLRAKGVTSALLNLGGNVHALGSKPDGSVWRVGVRDPESSEMIGAVEIRNEAVITSGGYERYFEQDGVTYWHIIDPSTAAPARSGLVSVSIISENGTLADAFSTALFVMGLDDAAEFWRESDDFEAIFVTEDDKLYITEGLEDSFTPLGRFEDERVEVLRRD